MTNAPLNGLILAGGRSSRLGFDKNSLQFHGKPQPEYLAEILKPFCKQVFISSRIELNELVIPVLTDYFTIEGPLNGLLTAFRHKPDTAWLTVPVDMPNVDTRLIKVLIEGRNPKKNCYLFLRFNRHKPRTAAYHLGTRCI
ncbi:NTP transferase domain-containing protein [Oscillatoria amoena NRMC-F 0135]|nr:NTP transferase domain-containing protein [Oscillatoria amoena NRMC-F 0135]